MHDQMEEFMDILHGKDKADSTVNQYEKGLELYSSWLSEEGLDPLEVSTRDLQRYLGYLKTEKEYAPKTIRLKFVAVNRFYSDLTNTDSLERNPADDVKVTDYAPKRTRKEEESKERVDWLSREEVSQLVENVPAPQIRNRLAVLFQYYTGLRRQEVCDVRISDLDREEQQVQIQGKNGKIHTAKWKPKMNGLLSTWLDWGYRESSPYARESEYLFVTESGPQLSAGHLNDVVKQAAENAGIQEVLYTDAGGSKQYKVTSHILRHSFAMHWLQDGRSIEGLSKNLAHSSVTTTEIYGEVMEERASDEYEKFNPDLDIEF